MWWLEDRIKPLTRLAVVLAAAGLLAGCFEPLYGRNPSVGDDSVRDKLAEIVIAPIPLRQGTPQARIAVAIRNALQFDLNGAAGAIAPTHRLDVTAARIVLRDSTFAHVGYDIPGSQQRFAKQRALIDAEDRAAKMAAEAIRNRLASYFVAGT